MLTSQQCAATQYCPQQEAEMQTKTTVLYCRLSVEDGFDKESNSITNQRKLITEYAERNGFTPHICLTDDGKSGTNFDRPGWQELMAMVDADEVGTIILKSLDRMGRNYLESGMLREVFAEKGIRLIAVNDGIDTFDHEDDFTPFREIMSEYYARDTSRKIKSVVHAKGREGKPLTSTIPYGFIKDPNDKNAWLIDEDGAADVVRRIFQLTIEGVGPYQIAKIFFNEKVERPSYYLAARGRGSHQANCNLDTPYTWSGETVGNIIGKAEYAGHTVNFRTSKPSFKSKKFVYNDSSEWLIFENTHSAIVSQETWDLAQQLRQTKRRPNGTGEANPLTGLLYCYDCKSRMYNHRHLQAGKAKKAHNGKVYARTKEDAYRCSACANSKVKFAPTCTEHSISTKSVRTILLEVIRATCGYIREHEQEFLERVRESSAVKANETAKQYRKTIAKNERRLLELEKIFFSLYEDKALEKIDEAMFTQMSGKYKNERDEIAAMNDEMKAELDSFENDSIRADKFIELVRKYTRIEELTTPMINEFIERVEIHDGEWSEFDREAGTRGSRTQEVDVYLKYIGRFDLPDTRTPEQLAAEQKAERQKAKRREYNRRYIKKKTAEVRAATA
jgi:DNA invertase Pin-like site-specific DNA recombinase